LRRNHRRQARAAEPGEPNVNNNNTGEHPHENTETAQAAFVAPSPQSGLQIFFATCYSFITSFFTSLVPDHPVPVDLN
uniref:Ovule protein n=1 Tax=Nippostrongylus brasiliensis TaxID=27835 RepID=A0A0N4XN59_NIPBR